MFHRDGVWFSTGSLIKQWSIPRSAPANKSFNEAKLPTTASPCRPRYRYMNKNNRKELRLETFIVQAIGKERKKTLLSSSSTTISPSWNRILPGPFCVEFASCPAVLPQSEHMQIGVRFIGDIQLTIGVNGCLYVLYISSDAYLLFCVDTHVWQWVKVGVTVSV